jgi:putative restriction endonuclease
MTVVRAYVGVTDNDWYRFLAARPEVGEVNFWQPSGGREFRVLAPSEPFFFKTHHPHNKVVGGGFFSDSARLRVSEAWELFGQTNGVGSIEQMRARIGRYRRAPIGSSEDPVIGCLFVRDVRFFPHDAIAEPPPGFAANIVQGKSYDLADQSVARYFEMLLRLLLGGAVVELDFSQPWHRPGPVFGDPRLAPYRLGQRSFQAVVLDAYHRRCAISGTHIPPVLQAAHIRPVADGDEHRLDNGLLLRSDVHTLFDCGYLAVDPRYRLLVSPRLREDFHNGDQFYARAGQVIDLPEHRADRPNRDFLDTNISAVCQAALRVELEREKAMEKIDADGYQRVKLYDGKREHDIAFRGRKVGSSQKADAWLTPKGTIAVYDHREQELWIYDEYGAFEDDEGLDNSLREQVAEALGAKYVEELDI